MSFSATKFSHRRDKNEKEIVAALRRFGATVSLIDAVRSDGVPDLLVGFDGRNYLIEVKSRDGKLSPGQKRWHEKWKGMPPAVARTIREAVAVIDSDGSLMEALDRAC